MEAFPLSGFDNKNGWDIWVLTCQDDKREFGDWDWNPSRSEFFNDRTEVAVLGLGQNVSSTDVQTIEKSVMPSIEPCWGLLFYLSRYARVDDNLLAELLQEHSFTGMRYANATSQILQHLTHFNK